MLPSPIDLTWTLSYFQTDLLNFLSNYAFKSVSIFRTISYDFC